MYVITVNTKGEVKTQQIGRSADEHLRTLVGGSLEVVRPVGLPRSYLMVVDGEFLYHGKEINALASWLYGTQRHGHPICGDVVIMKEGLVHGEPDLIGLDLRELKELTLYLVNLGGVNVCNL